MKKDIHPQVHDVTARCACGYAFQTRSTKQDISITLCAKCHPFYTGDQRLVDTAGQIDKFNKKFKKKA